MTAAQSVRDAKITRYSHCGPMFPANRFSSLTLGRRLVAKSKSIAAPTNTENRAQTGEKQCGSAGFRDRRYSIADKVSALRLNSGVERITGFNRRRWRRKTRVQNERSICPNVQNSERLVYGNCSRYRIIG